MRKGLRESAIFFSVMLLLAGCQREKAAEKHAEKFELVKPFTEVGAPVTVRVKVSKKEITIADFLRVVVEVEAGRRSTAKLPELKELDFGQFLVKDHYRLPSAEGKGGSRVESIEFSLEPQLSGEYTIGAFKVGYVVEGEPPDSEGRLLTHEIKAEPITVTVKSLGAKDLATAKLRDIKPPVMLAEPRTSRAMLIVAGGSAVLVGGGLVLFLLLRRKKVPPEKGVPPHVLAFEELRRLREMNLIEQGRIKEFYIAISDIMRFYIERRFAIQAPEQTTEEFLEAVSRDHVFDTPTRSTLKQFLSHCDMVKFAKYQPEMSEIQKAFDITRDFIEQTKPEEKSNAVSAMVGENDDGGADCCGAVRCRGLLHRPPV